MKCRVLWAVVISVRSSVKVVPSVARQSQDWRDKWSIGST